MTDQLNEVFDSESIYPTTNLTPKAKVPQIIHIQAPGTNDIVVRLTSSDTIGTRVKAVKPGDKVVQVFLTSMSEKGNITDFKGGLGSDPIGAINTIFDTVIGICKEYRIEAILFRFPKSKMKGKDQVAQRIIQRLTKTRTGGRYTTLTEIEGLSKKFAFSLLYRKNTTLQDVPGIPNIDPEKFEKVDTKVGETYVNKETGQPVSKSEAIAQTVVDEASKTSPQQVVAITKVSRQAALTMQGFHSGPPTSNMSAKQALSLNKLVMDPPLVAGDAKPSSFADINKVVVDELPGTIDKPSTVGPNGQVSTFSAGRYGMYATIVNSYLESGMGISDAHLEYKKIESELDDILSRLTIKNSYQKIGELVKHVSSQVAFQKQSPAEKHDLLSHMMSRLFDNTVYPMAREFVEGSKGTQNLTKPQKTAVKQYTERSFRAINGFLLGSSAPDESVLSSIGHIDEAIKNGGTLPQGVLLYRGQKVSYNSASELVENKFFTFRNYVSASIIPRIFLGGSFGAQSASTLDAGSSTEMGTDDPKHFLDNSLAQDDSDKLSNNQKSSIFISLGLVIKGGHKVKSINTAGISDHTSEAEVILPRGLITKIDKVYSSALNDGENTNMLMELDIVPPSELTESVDIYDGDLFMETGELKIVKPSLFSEMYYKKDTSAMELLAGLVNIDVLPEKFVM